MSDPWPRDVFAREVWASSLRPNQRLVALAYADHAADQDHAWVTYPRLMERTGLSRDAVSRALEGLRVAGWLAVKEPARQQRSARYWLRVPAQPSVSRTADDAQEFASRTPESTVPVDNFAGRPSPGPLAESSSPSPELSSPGDGPDLSSHHSTHQSSDDEIPGLPDAAEAVAAILSEHAPVLTEPQALAAVVSIDAWGRRRHDPVRDLVAFVRSRSLEELQRWAGAPVTSPSTQRSFQTPPCGECGAPDQATCTARQARWATDDRHAYAAADARGEKAS
jgi:hypothetical protein